MNNKFKRALSSVLAVVMMISVFTTMNVGNVLAAENSSTLSVGTHTTNNQTFTKTSSTISGITDVNLADAKESDIRITSSTSFKLTPSVNGTLTFECTDSNKPVLNANNETVQPTASDTKTSTYDVTANTVYTVSGASTSNTKITSITLTAADGSTSSSKVNVNVKVTGATPESVTIDGSNAALTNGAYTASVSTGSTATIKLSGIDATKYEFSSVSGATKVSDTSFTVDISEDANEAINVEIEYAEKATANANTNYTVSGTVSTAASNTITITGNNKTYKISAGNTSFNFNLPAGTYTIAYSGDDYTIASDKTFTVTNSDLTITINLELVNKISATDKDITGYVEVRRYELSTTDANPTNSAVTITSGSTGPVITNSTTGGSTTDGITYVNLKATEYVAFKIEAGKKYAVRLNSGDSSAILTAYNDGKIDGNKNGSLTFDSSYRLKTILLEAGDEDATFIITGSSTKKATKMKNITFYNPSVLRVVDAISTGVDKEVMLIGQFIGSFPEDYSEIGFALSKTNGEVTNVNNTANTSFHSTGAIYKKVYLKDDEDPIYVGTDENGDDIYYYAMVVTDVDEDTPFYAVGYTKLNGVYCRDTEKVFTISYNADGTVTYTYNK